MKRTFSASIIDSGPGAVSQALDALWNGISARSVNWVHNTDIKAFFDTLDHGWMLRFNAFAFGGDAGLLKLDD